MKLTDYLGNQWDAFNTSGWQVVVFLVICGCALYYLDAIVSALTHRAKNVDECNVISFLMFIAASIFVFVILYNIGGHWERHFFAKDEWITHWYPIAVVQTVASMVIGFVVYNARSQNSREVVERKD